MKDKISSKFRVPLALNFAAFIIIIAGVMFGESIVTPLLMAMFISIICTQPIIWLQKKKVPQGLSVAIVFIMILVVFFAFGELIAASLSSFSENEKVYEENLIETGNSIMQYLKEKGIKLSFVQMRSKLDGSKIMGLTASMLRQLGGVMGNAFTIFFLALFLLMELDSISVKTKAIMKGSMVSISYLDAIGGSIRHYLSIKTLTSLLTGILVWIGLAIVGVDYAIIWGLIAFLLNYIPNIGSFIAAFPAVVFVLIQLGFHGFIWTSIIFLIVNILVGNAIEPKMMGKGLGLSTFIVFLSLIFWGFVLGTVGMFLSVPLTMVIKIMLEQNPKTQWIAIILGTKRDAEVVLDE